MHRGLLAAALLIGSTGAAAAEAAEERQAQQVVLDRKCEAARQVALTPRREEIYQECIDRFGKQEDVCRNEADAYNGNRIGASPLFYELPECVEAFEYRKTANE